MYDLTKVSDARHDIRVAGAWLISQIERHPASQPEDSALELCTVEFDECGWSDVLPGFEEDNCDVKGMEFTKGDGLKKIRVLKR